MGKQVGKKKLEKLGWKPQHFCLSVLTIIHLPKSNLLGPDRVTKFLQHPEAQAPS